VRVYEKPRQGIRSYNGVFHLVDSWQEEDGDRQVFTFERGAVEGRKILIGLRLLILVGDGSSRHP
jgi:hypothetical protein